MLQRAELQIFAAEWPVSRIANRALAGKGNREHDVRCSLQQSGDIKRHSLRRTFDGGRSMGRNPIQGGMTEDLAFVEIDTSKVKKARDFLRVLENRRPELY